MRAGMGQERKVAPCRFRQGLRGRHAALTHRPLLEDTAATARAITTHGLRPRPRLQVHIATVSHAIACVRAAAVVAPLHLLAR